MFSLTAPPSVTCGVRSTDVAIGEVLEIVCTVNKATGLRNTQHIIKDMVYVNVKADGTERNITRDQDDGIFRFTDKVM